MLQYLKKSYLYFAIIIFAQLPSVLCAQDFPREDLIKIIRMVRDEIPKSNATNDELKLAREYLKRSLLLINPNAGWMPFFDDSFTRIPGSNIGANWIQVRGTYNIDEYYRIVHSGIASDALALVKGIIRKDISLKADVSLGSGARQSVGIVARYAESSLQDGSYYKLELIGDDEFAKLVLSKVKNFDQIRTIMQTDVVKPHGNIRIDVKDNHLKAYWNGDLKFDIEDEEIDGKGLVGITSRNLSGFIDNFVVSTELK
ncbi:MAG: hypothetical protein R3B45_03825 [Bdellovibrionota bacterium]